MTQTKFKLFNIADHIKGKSNRIRYLLATYPETMDYKFLLLYYWMIFDGIDIPKDVMKNIIEKGAEPNSISRLRRRIMEEERLLEQTQVIEQMRDFLDNEDHED